jgi:hypothetical protein
MNPDENPRRSDDHDQREKSDPTFAFPASHYDSTKTSARSTH